jgi:uncharacterized damage-inducible protein DinB
MSNLLDQIEYNYWANVCLVNATSVMDVERFTKIIVSSFPSVQETWLHILWAEELWFERWKGRSSYTELHVDDYPSVESIRNKIEILSANQIQFMKVLKTGDEDKKISYENIKGEKWEYTLLQMVQHMFIHSVYHRGQIATMLRQLGLQPPGLDYLVYIDEMAK